MINATTINKLHEMRLSAMAEAFQNQLKEAKYQDLSFEERVGIMVDLEWAKRRSNKLMRLIQKAEFRYPQASIEDIEYHARSQTRQSPDSSAVWLHLHRRKEEYYHYGCFRQRQVLPGLCFWDGSLPQLLYRQVHLVARTLERTAVAR